MSIHEFISVTSEILSGQPSQSLEKHYATSDLRSYEEKSFPQN